MAELGHESLVVSFWHVGLENLPEGAFVHRRLTPEQARTLIEQAREGGYLRCASHDDLLAPYHERERDQQESLCRVLREHYGITLSLEDFLVADETGTDDGCTIYPLTLVAVGDTCRLLVVSCHYELDRDTTTTLQFDVARESVTFHLFEAIVSDNTEFAVVTREMQSDARR